MRASIKTLAAAISFSPLLAIAAAPATQPTTKPVVSAELQQQFNAINTAYSKLKSLTVAGTIAVSTSINGKTDAHSTSFTGSFAAPTQFRHETKDDLTIGSTGEKSFVFMPSRNQYAIDDAPKTKADFLAKPNDASHAVEVQDPSLFIALSGDAAAALLDQATTAKLSPEEKIDGKPMTAIAISTADDDLTYLFDSQTHLLRQVRIDLARELAGQGVTGVTNATATYDITTTTPDAAVEAKQFAWTPPDGAKLAAANTGGMAVSDAEKNLPGKPAPAFTLQTADGKKVSLAELKGKVVVLDFWAIFCQPCKIALPDWDKFAKEKKGKPLAFYTVNVSDTADDIKAFAKETGLSLPVLIDADGNVAPQYGVEGIPETVLIGKDGMIKKVIVGIEEKGVADFKAAVEKEFAAP